MPRPIVSVIAALSLILSSATAQAQSLKVGSAAPTLKVAKWIKGTPVTQFERGKVYVVEFWATWCSPCRASIPHLTELAQLYKGKVEIIGVSISERDPKYASKVADFVKKMGAAMEYTVAIDTAPQAGFMSKNWMEPANQRGIPTAFIIGKDQKIAWIGNPFDMAKPLAKILTGTEAPPEEKTRLTRAQERQSAYQKIQALAAEGKNQQALALLDKYMAENPGSDEGAAPLRLDLLIATDETKARAFARIMEEELSVNNPTMLNTAAWNIIQRKNQKTFAYALALSLAERANARTQNRLWPFLDTLALAQFVNGKRAEAVATQTRAIELCKAEQEARKQPQDSESLKYLTSRLAEYQKAP